MLLMTMMSLLFSVWSCIVQLFKKQIKENINYFEILPMTPKNVISRAQSKRNIHFVLSEIQGNERISELFD
jgi:hypothetical protein